MASCCLCRLLAARLRSHEARQRGFILDGCGMEGVDPPLLLELLRAAPNQLHCLQRQHSIDHGSACSSGSTEAPASPDGNAKGFGALEGPGGPEGTRPLVEALASPRTPVHKEPQQSDPPLEAFAAVSGPQAAPPEERKPTADVKAKLRVPSLPLAELRPEPAANERPFALPTASSSDSGDSGDASSAALTASEASPSSAAQSPSQPSGGEGEDSAGAAHQDAHAQGEGMQAKDKEILGLPADVSSTSIDIVVVFEPETKDVVPPNKRLLAEIGPGSIQKAAAARRVKEGSS